jgi:cellobiose transport system substrate-binding protein
LAKHGFPSLLAIAATVASLITGCSSSSASDGKTKITVATFGEFGYEKLFADYEAAHPNIDIESRVADFEAHHKGFTTQLATGRGAADIVAVEEQYLPQFRQSTDKFVNLADLGALDLKDNWASWKWEQGVANEGKFVLGLGTDMGGMAMCYRRDLFEKAKLPTDRAEVAKLWPSWEAFAGVADKFSKAKTGAKFTDSAGTVYAAILNQTKENYFAAKDDSFIADVNPNLRRAFFIAGAIGSKGQTAAVTTYSQPWSVAIKQGAFATMACPAWMLALIQQAGGPENAGKWDITTVPGSGGNQGGSFLTLPKQGTHQKEAFDLVRWLTAPEQQKTLFKQHSILPSQPAVYKDPELLQATDPYFSNAPIGEIFAKSADSLTPNYRGLRDADVRPDFGRALGRIEEKKENVGTAFGEAVKEARAAIAQ